MKLFSIVCLALVAACTPQQQTAVENYVVAITPATCTLVEALTNSPFVTAVCDLVDPKTGATIATRAQKVQLEANSPVAVALKKTSP